MAAREHDLSVAFADVVVPGSDVDLTGWECWAHREAGVTNYYARGPCPACHASSQGHQADTSAPIESLGPDVDRPAERQEPVEVAVRCHCGSSHGREGATSCGRRWSILCPRQS